MCFDDILKTIGPLEVDSKDINYLLHRKKYNNRLLILLKYFNFDTSIFSKSLISNSNLKVSIDDLIKKLCDLYGISFNQDTLLNLSVLILNWMSDYEIKYGNFKVKDIVLDLSTTDDKVKKAFRKKLIVELRLFKNLVINKKEYSYIDYCDFDMNKLNLYIAYLIRNYMSNSLEEYVYDECLKALYMYLKNNDNLIESSYSFTIKDKVYSIRDVKDFVIGCKSLRIDK